MSRSCSALTFRGTASSAPPRYTASAAPQNRPDSASRKCGKPGCTSNDGGSIAVYSELGRRKLTNRRLFFVILVLAFAILLGCDTVLIYKFNEFEPKFGPLFNFTIAVIVDVLLAAAPAGVLTAARSFFRRSRTTFFVTLAIVVVASAFLTNSDAFKTWNARRAVRYVYWRNFAAGRKPLPTLESLEKPRTQLVLHGLIQLHTDPWGHPYHYELINDIMTDHPHRKNWDVGWAFWSNGPNGIDDGQNKKDDIDITNSGL